MSKDIVRQCIDLDQLPPLSAEQTAELAALATRDDSAIDYSDIPPLTDELWNQAMRGRFYKPTKTSTTIRLGRRCRGLVSGARERLPDAHQRHSAPRDARLP